MNSIAFRQSGIKRSDCNAAKRRYRCAAMGVLLAFANLALAAPDADLLPYWKAHNESSDQTIDHTAWARFLDQYLVQGDDGVNRVRYGAVSDDSRQALAAYIERLSEIDITDYRRDVQFAYWLNLYNALTVQTVLEHYPVDSIKDIDISDGWFADGPWDKELITVEGRQLSLNDIEHRILRPIWQDPRIHYAVNCASLGCPNLVREPYTAKGLDEMLTQRAISFINHPRAARIDDGELIVSSIYDWYQSDFGGSEQGVIRHLMQYAQPELESQLKNVNEIADYQYDWSLNDAMNT